MNESITVTPAANGYIVSKFEDKTPDHVFRTFEELVAHLRSQLTVFPVIKDPYGPGTLGEAKALISPPNVGRIGPRTMFDAYPRDEGATIKPTPSCQRRISNGGPGCPVCDLQNVL